MSHVPICSLRLGMASMRHRGLSLAADFSSSWGLVGRIVEENWTDSLDGWRSNSRCRSKADKTLSGGIDCRAISKLVFEAGNNDLGGLLKTDLPDALSSSPGIRA